MNIVIKTDDGKYVSGSLFAVQENAWGQTIYTPLTFRATSSLTDEEKRFGPSAPAAGILTAARQIDFGGN